jgi:hypothetical protein
MPKFKVLSRVDAFVDYVAEVDAESAEKAVETAYAGTSEIVWKRSAVVEFDAVHMVALDDNDLEIENTARGDFL